MIKKPASPEQMAEHAKRKHVVFFPTRYSFLKAHKGLRPNCLHGLTGTMGSGKSTLIKCIIAEVAAGKKVQIWLSEETIIEYQDLIQYLDRDAMKNIVFVHEKDIPETIRDSQDSLFEYFTQMAVESRCDIVFVDNVTTSRFYNGYFGMRGFARTADFFMEFVKKHCAVFYVAHTDSSITDNFHKVVTPENIRGPNDLPNVTEYAYVMQKFTSNEKQYNLLRTAKHRHHDGAGGWYALKFEQRAYVGDGKIVFELVNRLFKTRDFLGRKNFELRKEPEKNAAPGQKSMELENG
jgi:predicted ATP-dependent serine protease